MVSATRSRWGQRLGQKKAASEISNLCKQKDPKSYGLGNRQISRRMDTHGIIVVERFATFRYY